MRNMKKSTIMNTLKKKIREHKYKFTTQRQIILQAFLDSKENHMSAEDVYEMVRDENTDIGLACVSFPGALHPSGASKKTGLRRRQEPL